MGEEKKSQRDEDFWREVGEHAVVAVGVAIVTGGPDVAILKCDRPHACPPEVRSLSGVSLQCGGAFPRGEELHKGSRAFPTRGRVSEAHPRPPGSGMAGASVTRPTAHPEAEGKLVCPLLTALKSCCSHCRSRYAETKEAEPAAAAAASRTVRAGRAWRRGGRAPHG